MADLTQAPGRAPGWFKMDFSNILTVLVVGGGIVYASGSQDTKISSLEQRLGSVERAVTELQALRTDVVTVRARVDVVEDTLKTGRAERLRFQDDVTAILRRIEADVATVKAKADHPPRR